MATIQQVIDYLATVGETASVWYGEDHELAQELTGVSTDQAAGSGDLAWISPKQAQAHPERFAAFHGSLLIGPQPVQAVATPLLACENPKLAFLQAVNYFFPMHLSITWPAVGQQVAAGSQVAADVKLPPGVGIGSNVVIEAGVTLGPNTVIANCTIKPDVRVGANCTIGLAGFGYEKDQQGRYWRFPHLGRVIIEEQVEIGSNTCIDRGALGDTVIGRGVKIDNLVHVAHNVLIKPNTIVIANTMLGGSVTLEEDVWVAPSVSILNQIDVGRAAVLGMGAVVLKDVEADAVMVGNPAKLLRKKSV